MTKPPLLVLYVVLMIVVIVGVDLLFFRHQLWPRLIVNIAIVAAFGMLYLTVIRKP